MLQRTDKQGGGVYGIQLNKEAGLANLPGAVCRRVVFRVYTSWGRGHRKLWWTFSVHSINIHTHIKGRLCHYHSTEALVLDMALSRPNNTHSHKTFLAPYSLVHSRCSGGLWEGKGKREKAEDPLQSAFTAFGTVALSQSPALLSRDAGKRHRHRDC